MRQYRIRPAINKEQGYQRPAKLKKRVEHLIEQLQDIYGQEVFAQKADDFQAQECLQSGLIEQQILGIYRIICRNPHIEQIPAGTLTEAVGQQENLLTELRARQKVEEDLQQKVNERVEQRYAEYIREIKLQVLKEESRSVETPYTFTKLGQLQKMEFHGLKASALERLRPTAMEEIIGQEQAMRALAAKLNSPFPQHILLYGPPGVGKTTCARLALQMARTRSGSVFRSDAPFIEVDGSTLRWDPRESSNPLLGSVHDPIYQGAKRELAEDGIPEPKLGLVSEANGGILFIDEIGEMDPTLQNKLLKVMEDKRVYFESSYYDPHDERVPEYIKKIFDDGVPADFILIGATTRSPEEMNPAFRSRCMEVFFEPLTPENIQEIVKISADKLGIEMDLEVPEKISEYCVDGRNANKILANAYSLAINEYEGEKPVVRLSTAHVQEALQNSRSTYCSMIKAQDICECGRIFGVGVVGYLGQLIEIETIAFPCEAEQGSIRFNETAGSMARDSVANAASVFRKEHKENLNGYDVHINVIGGGKVDGPSAGAAIYLAISSAVYQLPIWQNVAITGEISIQGKVRPVGGIHQKILAARRAGIRKLIIPADNMADVPVKLQDIEIIPISDISEAYPHVFGPNQHSEALLTLEKASATIN